MAALSRLDGDQELLASLLVMAFHDLPQTIAEIEVELKNGNANKIRLHAHNFKGDAATLGATALAGVAAQIQGFASDGQLLLIGATLALLKSEMIKFQAATSQAGY